MIIWTIFLITLLTSCLIHENGNNIQKNAAFFFIIFIATYFSGFRDGVGIDYQSYKDFNSVFNYQIESFWLSEPFYLYLSRFIYNSSFSYVLFFVVMSLITIYCTFKAYSRYGNLFVLIYVFILFPSIFMTTFTLVRSFAAAGIAIYSIKYIENKSVKSIIFFLLLIAFAFTIHKSSIIFLILPFLNNKDYRLFSLYLLLLLLILISYKNLFGDNMFEILQLFKYDTYLDYDLMKLDFFSSSIIFLHLFLFPLFYYRKQILNLRDSSIYVIPIKCFIIALFFADISAFVIPFAYRLFYSFIIFFPIVFLATVKVLKIPIINTALYILVFAIGVKSLISGIDNPLIISDSILSPFRLFD